MNPPRDALVKAFRTGAWQVTGKSLPYMVARQAGSNTLPKPGESNWKNRTLFISDNLPVLRGLNSEMVDLIYLDPPFNNKKQYKAPIGTPAEGQKSDDTWRWTDLAERWLGEIDWRNRMQSPKT